MLNYKKEIRKRLDEFYNQLSDVCNRCGRSRDEIEVLYATKYLTPIQFASFLKVARKFDKGKILVGENRLQEAKRKIEYLRQLHPPFNCIFTYAMIGTLQKNKINKTVEFFNEIHSVDSLDLAKALDERLDKLNKKMPVMLEVNVSGEERKHGFHLAEVELAFKELRLLRSLKIKGLMTMASYTQDEKVIRGVFRTLRQLADRYKLKTSMGMSNDWRIAVEEGSNILRIGSLLFG